MYSKDNTKKELKSLKTQNELKKAFVGLLNTTPFSKITINDICATSLLSRGTFYSHFEDKYDLLKSCLEDIKIEFYGKENENTDEEVVSKMSDFVYKESKMLKNLLDGTNEELRDMFTHLISLDIDKMLCEKKIEIDNDKKNIFLNFLAGGFANVLLYQIKNNFPDSKPTFEEFMLSMFKVFKDKN